MMTVGRRGEASPASSINYQSASPTHQSMVGTSGLPTKQICISVVGLSGTEKDKGPVGVGKSCLCNRFVRPHEDDYYTDHISTLSQVDFSGSPVINNDHWLYWGERSLLVGLEHESSNQRAEWQIKVIEQTEFVDDESFQPLKATGPHQKEMFIKRAAAIKLQSADKLMYICKDQLGLEAEYDQRPLLPEGKINVDGFVCVFDVSPAHKRPFEQQAAFLLQVLTQICKFSKKPILLATTKHDEVSAEGLKEAERLLSRKELRGYGIQMVETSAHQNVNVESAFILLAHQIEKLKAKPKVNGFREAARLRNNVMDMAKSAYLRKLKLLIPSQDWPKRRVSWQQLLGALGLGANRDFIQFCELYGKAQAQRLYRQYVKELKDEWMQRRLQNQVSRLPRVIADLLPEISAIRGLQWHQVLQYIQNHPHFEQFFQPIGSLGAEMESNPLDLAHTDDDPRIPAELLLTPDAEIVYKNHINSLEAQLKRQRIHEDFEQLLIECTQVTPGKPLSDVRIFFLGKDCFEALPDAEAQEIYERYQRQLVKRAREDFVELLLENIGIFSSRLLFRRPSPVPINPHAMPGLSEKDMVDIHDKLEEDFRYRQLNRLFQARENMICQYVSFVSYPLRQHCPARNRCVDSQVEQLLISHLPQSKSTYGLTMENGSYESYTTPVPLNLIILGMTGLPDQLVREIRLYLPQDLYQSKLPGTSSTLFSLCYRCIDGDVRLPRNSLSPTDFRADTLVLVFSSRESLDYVRDSLAQTLLSTATTSPDDNDRPEILPPTVVVVACDPNHLDDLPYLQQQGSVLAETLRAPFVRVGSSKTSPGRTDVASTGQGPSLFSSDQIYRLLDNSVLTKRLPSNDEGFDQPPDIRLMMCAMCGDPQSPYTVLGPLLSRQCAAKSVGNNVLTFETLLPAIGKKIRVETRITAYHTALLSHCRGVDGFVLVYSTRRRASLTHLDAFVKHTHNLAKPTLMIAVGEVTEFFSDRDTNALITEGNELADKMGCRFATVSPAAEQQVGTYTPFLEETYTQKQQPKVGDVPPKMTTVAPNDWTNKESDYAPLSQFRSGYWPNGDGQWSMADDDQPLSVQQDDMNKSSRKQSAPTVMDERGQNWRYTNSMKKAMRSDSPPYDLLPTKTGPLLNVAVAPTDPAPLATPEHIEIGVEYMTVKDALGRSSDGESEYATLDSFQQRLEHTVNNSRNASDSSTQMSTSPSEVTSSLEKNRARSPSPYDKVGRKPTPHKRRQKSGEGNGSGSPRVGPGIAERLKLLNQDFIAIGGGAEAAKAAAEVPSIRRLILPPFPRSASEESLLAPVGRRHVVFNSQSGDELEESPENDRSRRPKRKGFVRKVASSFRFRKNSASSKKRSLEEEYHIVSISNPQSPMMQHHGGIFVLPPVPLHGMDIDVYSEGNRPRTGSSGSLLSPNAPSTSSGSSGWLKSPKKERAPDFSAADSSKKLPGGFRRSSGETQMKKKGSGSNLTSMGVVPPNSTLADLAPSATELVPVFVKSCVEFIEQEGGLQFEGLYRVPGNQAQVSQLEAKYCENPNISFKELDAPLNAVATALKNFFSYLSEPVIPTSLYERLLENVNWDTQMDSKLLAIQRELDNLPPENKAVLRYFTSHLNKVAERADQTSMDHRNLAKCWWPTLLRPHFDSFESMAQSTPRLEEFTQILLQNSEFLLR